MQNKLGNYIHNTTQQNTEFIKKRTHCGTQCLVHSSTILQPTEQTQRVILQKSIKH